MKVLTGTLLTLATGTGGLLALPALGRAMPAVHLVTSIQALPHGPDEVRYAVTVRPVGGPAHTVTAVLGTRRPAAWTAIAPGCLSSPDRTTLACDLGDVREAQSRTLRLTAQPGDLADVPVVVQVRAANAPAVTSSLATRRPVGLRRSGEAPRPRGTGETGGARGFEEPPRLRAEAPLLRHVGEPSAPRPAEAPPAPSAPPALADSRPPSAAPEPSGSAEPPRPSESPAVVAPSGESAEPVSAEPAESEPASPTAPAPSPPAESPAAVRPPDRHAPPRQVPPRPAPHRGPAASPPGRPPHSRSGTAAPHTPVISHVPAPPGAGVPGAGAHDAGNPPPAPVPPPEGPVPPPGGLMGGPGNAPGKPPPSSPSPALPEIAPQSSPGAGISELSTVSPASAMSAGRVSWATTIAVAVVAEAGLLWLVTGFAMWRRRRPSRRRARSHRARRRPVLSRSRQ